MSATAAIVAVVAFAAMEPVTYATHRWVMHGPGMRLHRSHHARRRTRRWEDNDAFPLAFASVAMVVAALGFNLPRFAGLVPVLVGVTCYGLAYGFVHDVYIHRRLPFPGVVVGPLERLRAAHRIHHLFGGEPYGMLAPVVPRDLRERAAATTADPLAVAPAVGVAAVAAAAAGSRRR